MGATNVGRMAILSSPVSSLHPGEGFLAELLPPGVSLFDQRLRQLLAGLLVLFLFFSRFTSLLRHLLPRHTRELRPFPHALFLSLWLNFGGHDFFARYAG